MTFVSMGKEFKNTKEQPLHPEGLADLVIREAELEEKPDGRKSVRILIDIEGDKEYRPIMNFLQIPHPKMDKARDEEKGNKPGTATAFKNLMAKRFCNAFKIALTDEGYDLNDFKGARARLGVSVVTIEQGSMEGQKVNNVKIPNLPEEV